MTTKKQGSRSALRGVRAALAMAVVATVGTASAVHITGDANTKTTYLDGRTVITVTQTGKLTVVEPGEIELLMVGGGGGGGLAGSETYLTGGGGGAGGVIHKKSFAVEAQTYDVVIGVGGEPNKDGYSKAKGGNTTAFGLTAYGGGAGAHGGGAGYVGSSAGGSGGGGSIAWGAALPASGQSTEAASAGNMGHAGYTITAYSYNSSGGGGGAGADATGKSGGDGYCCNISGKDVWYAGGGAGGGAAGQGGGSACYGGGGNRSAAGGPGVVIVSFVRTARPASADFAISGYDEKFIQTNGTYAIFKQDGGAKSLKVTGTGSLEVLLVGGGGGGGATVLDGVVYFQGGGGGGGGVIHLKDIPVSDGQVIPITVGAGGVVNKDMETTAVGGNTTAFGFTAYGGGFGAKALALNNASSGASGGGGSKGWGDPTSNGFACHAAEFNLGHDGAAAGGSPYASGGGGGAGTAGSGMNGGDGYLCTITGEDAYYGGGGAGSSGTAGLGGGSVYYGGGGNAGTAGGAGVVIVRYVKDGEYQTAFDGATGGNQTKRFRRGNRYFKCHAFTTDGTFKMPVHGLADILLVGGGGGGGVNFDGSSYGGGGGAGGLIYKQSVVLEKGDHPITIGAGGAVGENGGDTVAFNFVANGGGAGAKGGDQGGTGGAGANGGGSTTYYNGPTFAGGRVSDIAVANGNVGHAGGGASNYCSSGGGGGAGGPGHDGGTAFSIVGDGGDGLEIDIANQPIYFAGGGAGGVWGLAKGGLGGGGGGVHPAGTDGLGGGGAANNKGGSGVVIIRYELPYPPPGALLIVR